ncbi:TPA: hypothetical protein ACK3JW_000148 [Mannheimia haemolytica]
MKNKLANINSNNGHFIDGNPATGTLGTIVTAEWLNGVQDRMQDVYEELRNVLLLANMQPDGQRQNQVAEAVKAYCNNINLKVQSNTRNFDNYIPNSKKSNAVNSNSADTVATSVAVKTAHDKALEAKSIAETKQSPATTLAGYGITDFLVKGESSTTNARTLLKDGIYAFGSSSTTDNLPSVHPYKLLNLAGNNPNWRHQIAIKAYSTEIYLSSQQSSGSDTWLEWRRIDGADWADIRNNPITIQQSLGTKDLDTVLEVGIYGQVANANAIPARHYPEQMAGTLLVTPSAYGVQQEYTTFYLNRKYVRGRRDNNAWSNWTRIDGVDKVDKSGDTMTGALEINAPDTFIRFKRNGENIGFAGTPNTTSENIKLHSYKHDTFLELQAAKAYINKALELAGNIAIKSGDYSNVELFNRANKRLIVEVSPDSTSSIGNIIYRNASNSNEANINIPRKTGTMALLEDFSYQKIGNFEVRKYPDGTMIQTYTLEQQDLIPERQGNPSFNWAVAFRERPLVMGNITTSINSGHDTGINILSSSTNAAVFYYVYEHGSINQGLCRLQFIGIGKWK